MIERLEKFARQFYWLKPILLVIAVGSLLTSVVVTLRANALSDDVLLIPALLLFCWCCITYSVLSLFVSVPARADHNTGRWKRIKISLVRSIYFLLALVTVILTLMLLYISYQLMHTWIRSY